MSNPAAIIDRVCAIAKLNSAAASADRVLVLSFLNEAMARVCTAADIRVLADSTVSLTQGQAVYSLNSSPFPTDMIMLLDVVLTDNSVTSQPLRQTTFGNMRELRSGSVTNESPYTYAVDYPQFVLFPTPDSNASLSISYSKDPASLSDNSTAITLFPEAFQWGCLYEFALAKAFEYKKQPEAAEHMNAFFLDRSAGLPALKRWKALSGGRNLPTDDSGLGRPRTSTSQDFGF